MINWNNWQPDCIDDSDDFEDEEQSENDCYHKWMYLHGGKRVCSDCLINDRGEYEHE